MGIYKKVILLLVIVGIAGCGSGEFTSGPPSIPPTLDVDVDEDGIVDFAVEYGGGYILSPTSTEGIFCNVLPKGENLVLHKKDAKNLFLRNIDDVKDIVQDPLFWNNQGWTETIASIQNNSDGLWPDKWEINSDNENESYFLGLKLINDSSTHVGWIEFKVNKKSGAISIIEKGLI